MRRALLITITLALLFSAPDSRLQFRQELYSAFRTGVRAMPVWSDQGWLSQSSAHFQIYYQASESSLVAGVLTDLESSYAKLRVALAIEVATRTPVFLQPSLRSMDVALGGAAGATLGAYQSSRLHLLSPLAWRPDLEPELALGYYRDNGPVAHELTHLLLDYRVSGNIPVWLSEGLAQYWERELKGYVWEETTPWVDAAVSLIQLSQAFSTVPENVAYRESLAVVDWLYFEHGTAAVTSITQELAAGSDFPKALEKCLGLDLQELDAAWRVRYHG